MTVSERNFLERVGSFNDVPVYQYGTTHNPDIIEFMEFNEKSTKFRLLLADAGMEVEKKRMTVGAFIITDHQVIALPDSRYNLNLLGISTAEYTTT